MLDARDGTISQPELRIIRDSLILTVFVDYIVLSQTLAVAYPKAGRLCQTNRSAHCLDSPRSSSVHKYERATCHESRFISVTHMVQPDRRMMACRKSGVVSDLSISSHVQEMRSLRAIALLGSRWSLERRKSIDSVTEHQETCAKLWEESPRPGERVQTAFCLIPKEPKSDVFA